ncbi:MAG TPA: EthD family reductase [Gammaproteobacteria bacterium]|nr:EthD family reductase [Gammaproteobacteria bacterium]
MTTNNDSKPTRESTRREVLAGAARLAVVGAAAGSAAVTSMPASAQGEAGEECMTIVYRYAPDARFDFDYYESTHMPLIMRLYGDSIRRFELRRGLPGADGSPPPYIATITIWIADVAAFEAAAAEHQEGIRADVDKFTNAELIAQRDRIVAYSTS